MPFTDVKGVRTFYEEYGDPKSNKHVLFIHGLGDHPLPGAIFQMHYQNIFIR